MRKGGAAGAGGNAALGKSAFSRRPTRPSILWQTRTSPTAKKEEMVEEEKQEHIADDTREKSDAIEKHAKTNVTEESTSASSGESLVETQEGGLQRLDAALARRSAAAQAAAGPSPRTPKMITGDTGVGRSTGKKDRRNSSGIANRTSGGGAGGGGDEEGRSSLADLDFDALDAAKRNPASGTKNNSNGGGLTGGKARTGRRTGMSLGDYSRRRKQQ